MLPRRVTLVILLVLLSGCEGAGDLIRRATYPPDFNYVSGDELRSSMDQLGYQLQQLDLALAPGDSGRAVDQQQVLSVLASIERIGTNLRAGDSGSNHPFLEDHMSNFVVDVGRARIAAMANPPSYYLAGRVSGGCVSCHRINR